MKILFYCAKKCWTKYTTSHFIRYTFMVQGWTLVCLQISLILHALIPQCAWIIPPRLWSIFDMIASHQKLYICKLWMMWISCSRDTILPFKPFFLPQISILLSLSKLSLFLGSTVLFCSCRASVWCAFRDALLQTGTLSPRHGIN